MVYHPNEFETAVTLGQNEPLYCNVPDSLSESLARARLPHTQALLLFAGVAAFSNKGSL